MSELFSSVSSLLDLVVNSVSVFFTGISYCFDIVLAYIDSMPVIFSYGLRLSIAISVTVVVVNILKGLL